MKKLALFVLIGVLPVIACKKSGSALDVQTADLQKIYADNSAKVSISNGVWGTVSTVQGDCMPTTDPKASTCKSFAIQREVRVYAYTKSANASPAYPLNGLYDSFNTQLIKTINADAQGFYEATLPDGTYTVVMVENGKLYATTSDAQGGLSAVTIQRNKVNLNLVLNRAVY